MPSQGHGSPPFSAPMEAASPRQPIGLSLRRVAVLQPRAVSVGVECFSFGRLGPPFFLVQEPSRAKLVFI